MRQFSLRLGFTLVEVLVVIAILGILISLVTVSVGPALQRADRLLCEERMRQIGVATIDYENTSGHLPAYLREYGQFAGGSDPADPGNFSGNVPRHLKIGSWQIALLSTLDQAPIHERWLLDRYPILSDGKGELPATAEGYTTVAAANIEAFQCPSANESTFRYGKNHYVANTGLHADSYPFTYTRINGGSQTVSFQQSISKANGAFTNGYAGFDPSDPSRRVPLGKSIQSSSFKDGISQTVLYTENNQAQAWHLTRLSGDAAHLVDIRNVGGQEVVMYPPESRYLQGFVWHFEHPLGVAGARNVDARHRINGGDIVNERMTLSNHPHVARPSSLHIGGVNMVMADGRVQFVGESIDYQTLQALMTPNGNRSDMPNNEHVVTEEL